MPGVDRFMTDAASNLDLVTERIRLAARNSGRAPSDITLVAVSKTQDFGKIRAVYGEGQRHFGENKVQELVPKMEQAAEWCAQAGIEDQFTWHMIGVLQSNKIKYMAARVDWIHSVPKLKTLLEIEKRAEDARRVINVLIQVNISEEDQKSGCDPGSLKELLLDARPLRHVVVRGLMGMASFEANPEVVRPQFALLRQLRDGYRHLNEGALQLTELSMGMTHDLEIAVEEGATMVRVGSAIFGDRA